MGQIFVLAPAHYIFLYFSATIALGMHQGQEYSVKTWSCLVREGRGLVRKTALDPTIAADCLLGRPSVRGVQVPVAR
jgi:hypothetical protein